MNPDVVETEIRQWLDQVVIGLNLCPFAARPVRAGALRILVSAAETELDVLTDLQLELQRLDDHAPSELETTLIAVPLILLDFPDYNDFLDQVDLLLQEFGWEGRYQVASFHPDYQFAGTEPGDVENLTNRAPYPLLHLLREDSVEAAVAAHPDAEGIPETNIRTLRGMDAETRRRLFGYLG